MKLLIPFALMAAVTICGIGDKPAATPLANSAAGTADRPFPDTSPAPAATATPKPVQDREAVKRELISLANDNMQASKDGDVAYLTRATSDDFQLTDIDGSVKSKNKALAEVKEEKTLKSFEISNGQLVSLDESSAVLTYTLKVTAKNGGQLRATTTDTFVRQDGKWLLRSEQLTLQLR